MHCRLMPLAERECNRKRNVSNNKINNLNTATLHLFFLFLMLMVKTEIFATLRYWQSWT